MGSNKYKMGRFLNLKEWIDGQRINIPQAFFINSLTKGILRNAPSQASLVSCVRLKTCTNIVPFFFRDE